MSEPVSDGGTVRNLIRDEPVAAGTGLLGLVTAMIGLGVAFGFPMSAAQQQATLALAVAMAPLFIYIGKLMRDRVTPVHRAAADAVAANIKGQRLMLDAANRRMTGL